MAKVEGSNPFIRFLRFITLGGEAAGLRPPPPRSSAAALLT